MTSDKRYYVNFKVLLKFQPEQRIAGSRLPVPSSHSQLPGRMQLEELSASPIKNIAIATIFRNQF
jgi:hypothetical protein